MNPISDFPIADMTEDEADQYRYLEGVDCNVFTTAVIISALTTATGSLGLPR